MAAHPERIAVVSSPVRLCSTGCERPAARHKDRCDVCEAKLAKRSTHGQRGVGVVCATPSEGRAAPLPSVTTPAGATEPAWRRAEARLRGLHASALDSSAPPVSSRAVTPEPVAEPIRGYQPVTAPPITEVQHMAVEKKACRRCKELRCNAANRTGICSHCRGELGNPTNGRLEVLLAREAGGEVATEAPSTPPQHIPRRGRPPRASSTPLSDVSTVDLLAELNQRVVFLTAFKQRAEQLFAPPDSKR